MSRFLQNGASRATAARHMTEHLENFFTQSAAEQTAEVSARIVGAAPMPV
jgi:hypothetical protein